MLMLTQLLKETIHFNQPVLHSSKTSSMKLPKQLSILQEKPSMIDGLKTTRIRELNFHRNLFTNKNRY
jgi:hypothetical protein